MESESEMQKALLFAIAAIAGIALLMMSSSSAPTKQHLVAMSDIIALVDLKTVQPLNTNVAKGCGFRSDVVTVTDIKGNPPKFFILYSKSG